MRPDAVIAELAVSQHGLLTTSQAREAGLDRRHLERRVARGQLTVAGQDVYRIAGVAPTWEGRVHAAVLAAGPGAVASHLTAAALWRLDGFGRTGRPEISIPRGRFHRTTEARCHTSTDLDRCTVVLREGIATTDLCRTLLDVGRYLGAARLDRVVENARRAHGLERLSLLHTLMSHARQGRHGIRRLRRVLTAHADRDVVTDSEFEILVVVLLAERGLPAPVLHHEIWAGDVLLAEVDLAWTAAKVAVELHGRQHQEDRAVWEADQVKAVELQAVGWTYLPFTWRNYVRRPAWMVARIARAIGIS